MLKFISRFLVGVQRTVNRTAIVVMIGILVAWAALLLGAFIYGEPWPLAIFAIVTIAMYVPWGLRR